MHTFFTLSVQFSSVQSLSHVQFFATPWIAARQASLSITNSHFSLCYFIDIDKIHILCQMSLVLHDDCAFKFLPKWLNDYILVSLLWISRTSTTLNMLKIIPYQMLYSFFVFSKSSLNIWKFSVHVLLKSDLENFEC